MHETVDSCSGTALSGRVRNVLCALVALGALAALSVPPVAAQNGVAPYWTTGTDLETSAGASFIRVGGDAGWEAAQDVPSPFVGAYEVYRSTTTITAQNPGFFLAKISSESTRHYDDYGGIAGEDYYYAIIALDEDGLRSTDSSIGIQRLTAKATAPGSSNPHAAYAENSNACGSCHVVHSTPSREGLRKATEREVCYTCHDGTGSTYDVRTGSLPGDVSDFGESTLGESTKRSYHPVPNDKNVITPDRSLVCSSCHDPHQLDSADPRLLAAEDSATATSGNAFCWVCHGTNSSANGYNLGGDHYTRYFNSAVHSAEASLPLTATAEAPQGWQPPSGTKINCENCHVPHGADSRRLTHFRLEATTTVYNEERLCFGEGSACHGTASATADVQTDFTTGTATWLGQMPEGYYQKVNTRHDVSDDDQAASGTKIECTNCHNAHVSTRSNPAVDPDDRIQLWTQTRDDPVKGVVWDSIDFCLSCHDNTWAADGSVEGTTSIVNVASTYLFDKHGDSAGTTENAYSGGYHRNYPRMLCTACHDEHGGRGIYHLKTLTDQYGTPTTVTDPSSHEVAHWCSNCHVNPMGKIDSTDGNCISSDCHAHGSGAF